MREIIRQAIDRVYLSKDYDFFIEKSKFSLKLFHDIEQYVKEKNIKVTGGVESCWGNEWIFKFPKYKKDAFEAEIQTLLKISKLVPVYYMQYEFDIENIMERRMSPSFDGWSCLPHTIYQAELSDKIKDVLDKNNYTEIQYRDLIEVVPDLKYDEDVTIFGPQVTVEQLIFNDVFGICE